MMSTVSRVNGADILARNAEGWKDRMAAVDLCLPCGSGPSRLLGESNGSGAWSNGSSIISGVLALAPVFITRDFVSNYNNEVTIMLQ